MKKIISLILVLALIMAFSACGKVEITTQEIYDAGQIEAMLQNHQSIFIRDEIDDEFFTEKYLTKEYVYAHYFGEESEYAEFITDGAKYVYSSGDYLRYLFITSDGVTNGFASERAEYYASVLTATIADETIESVSKKDGRIIVNGVLSEEAITDLAEYGIISSKTEYALDAKTNELISVIADYALEDGAEDGASHFVTEIAYDADVPEMLEIFMKYENQTEDLRNVTIVTNPGTEKETSQNFQFPKDLIIGFSWDDAFEDKVELYADAACTEAYDAYVSTDSDLTIYVKWSE